MRKYIVGGLIGILSFSVLSAVLNPANKTNALKTEVVSTNKTEDIKRIEARLNAASIDAGFGGGDLEHNDDYIEYVSRTEDISHITNQFADKDGNIPSHRFHDLEMTLQGVKTLVTIHRIQQEKNTAQPVNQNNSNWVDFGKTTDGESIALDINSIQSKPHAGIHKWFTYRINDRTNNASTSCDFGDAAVTYALESSQQLIEANSTAIASMVDKVCE